MVSTDRSGEILQDILATSSRVSVITFRRNLGKSAALAAGFTEAQYGIVITLDADLQDDPLEFVNLIGARRRLRPRERLEKIAPRPDVENRAEQISLIKLPASLAALSYTISTADSKPTARK